MKENNAAQAAKPQTVLSFDERERILGQFIREPINHDREMAIAIETTVLSKLRAPVADERDRNATIGEVVGLCNRIPGATTWNAAQFMYDEMHRRAALASAPVAATTDRAMLQSVLQDLEKSESVCPRCGYGDSCTDMDVAHMIRDHLKINASAPVAGEAVGVVQPNGDTFRLSRPLPVGTKVYAAPQASAKYIYDTATGTATPQVSAEDVRNATLEEAAKLMDQTSRSSGAALIRALKQPQAAQDGEVERMLDGDDIPDFSPGNGNKAKRRAAALRLRDQESAALSASQPEQGERDEG